MLYTEPRIISGGDKALFVEFGDTIDEGISHRVRNLFIALKEATFEGIIETVPTYRSLLVYYNPLQIDFPQLQQKLLELAQKQQAQRSVRPTITRIPTVYGGEYGPDLEYVARHNGLNPEDVIALHTGTVYPIYMLGFLPGFPYLGGISPRIATPRLKTPRNSVPSGSVGIAEKQTGIYPTESPGGWQLIGRTPLILFDARREQPSLLEAGNYLQFFSINPTEYSRIKAEIEKGTYSVSQKTKED